MSKIEPDSPGTSPFVFGGFALPRYTTVPDEVFDVLLAQLSGAELKVLLYIIRRTFGFKKEADSISIAQMCNGIQRKDGSVLDSGTGLSRQSVITAVKALEIRGIIVARRNSSAARGDEATTYSLHFANISGDVVSQPSCAVQDKLKDVTEGGLENRRVGVKKSDSQGSKNMAGGVKKHDPQQTALQQTALQQQNLSNDSMSTQTELSALSDQTEPEQITLQQNNQQEPVLASYAVSKMDNPSAAINACVTDYSRELGDSAHIHPNRVRAQRLWQKSGLSESAFCTALHDARQRVRDRQMVAGGVNNRMAYFFGVLEQCCGLRPAISAYVPVPNEPQPVNVDPSPTTPSWWTAYGSRYSQAG